MSNNGQDLRKDDLINSKNSINENAKENAAKGPSGTGESSGDLFNAYIRRINSMSEPGSYADISQDALADADRVIAEAEKRREALRKKQELEEAIAETDREVEELSRKRRGGAPAEKPAEAKPVDPEPAEAKPSGAKPVKAGSAAAKPAAAGSAAAKPSEAKPAEAESALAKPSAARVPESGASKTGAPKSGASKAGVSKSGASKADAPKADAPAAETSVPEEPSAHVDYFDTRRTPGSSEGGQGGQSPAGEASVPPIPPKKRRSPLKWILLLLFVAAAAALSVYLIRKYTPTSRRMSYTDYFGSMAENEAAIVLQDQNLEERALVSENRLYIPYGVVRGRLNGRFFWDETRGNMLFTTPLQTFEIPINSTSYSVIDGALTEDPTGEETYDAVIVLRDDAGNLFVSLDYLCRYTNVTYSWEKETQHVYLRNAWGDTLTADAVKDAAVRFEGNIKSPILTDLDKGDRVMVLEEAGKWLRVLTEDGFIGYAKAGRMSTPALITVENEGFVPQDYTSLASDETISVVWHMLSTKNDSKNIDDVTAEMSGVDVISPTWFSLLDNDGNVESIASKAYVKKAHAKGLKVWGLVSDFSSDMDTSLVLASTAARRSCIGQLVDYAQKYALDGINLDFEYVEEADGANYSQFVREMSIACRRAGLVLSVDLVPPYDFNAYLDRLEIATVADYLINMGYDEHYSGSEAGSVASLGYEEQAMQRLLDLGIPAHKILSGIPFYTRIWYTAAGDDGQTYVSSEELSMNGVQATLESWSVTPRWDSEAVQNYAEWVTGDGVLCQIWIEDADSLARKALLVPKYQLGGTAAWVLGFENSSIWPVLEENANLTQEEAAAREQALIEEKAASEQADETEEPETKEMEFAEQYGESEAGEEKAAA